MCCRKAAGMIAAFFAILALAGPARAETVEEFYKGKTITLIVSSSPGGGYDTLSRLISRHVGRHVPGAPAIVVRNMPGAGGLVATNHLYTVAAKDGTVIGGVQNNTPFEPLFGTPQANYEPTKFNWLGSPNVETGLVIVWNTVPASTIADLKTKEITVGSSGANSTPSFYARLINEVLGTKIRTVAGYPGQSEAFLAMERGELDGYPSTFYTSLNTTRPAWLPEKKIKVLLQYGPQKEPELGDVPLLLDLITDPQDRLMAEAAFAPLALGRPYLMPPGVPADRLAAMRKAFSDTFADPAFAKEGTDLRLGLNAPRSGDEIQKTIEKIYATPSALIERLKKLQGQ